MKDHSTINCVTESRPNVTGYFFFFFGLKIKLKIFTNTWDISASATQKLCSFWKPISCQISQEPKILPITKFQSSFNVWSQFESQIFHKELTLSYSEKRCLIWRVTGKFRYSANSFRSTRPSLLESISANFSSSSFILSNLMLWEKQNHEDMIDYRSYAHNLSSCEIKAWKISDLNRNFHVFICAIRTNSAGRTLKKFMAIHNDDKYE